MQQSISQFTTLDGNIASVNTVLVLSSRQLNLKKVLVSGGSLDHRIDPQLLHDGGGEKLVILALDEAGRVSDMRH